MQICNKKNISASLPEASFGTGQPLRVVIKIVILISVTFICIFIPFVDGTQLATRPLVLYKSLDINGINECNINV